MAADETIEEWLRTVLEDRHCMDCKVPLDEGEGMLEFRGLLPHVEYLGSLCTPCQEQRETIRRLRTPQP
jgi:hypothetical protein